MTSSPIPMAARSNAWVCGRSIAGIADSNPSGGIDICVLRLLCVMRWKSLRQADNSPRSVLPNLMCLNERDREASIKRRLWPTRGCCTCVNIHLL